MHPVNRVLSLVGLQLSRINETIVLIDKKEKDLRSTFLRDLEKAKNNQRGFEVFEAYRYQMGKHPRYLQDMEFEFVAYHLQKVKPL